MNISVTPVKPKAIVLLSGGLDSTLAEKSMLEQNIDVEAVNFTSPFCACGPRQAGTCRLAADVADNLGIKIRVLNKGLEYLKIVEHPRFGFGRGVNPCIVRTMTCATRSSSRSDATSAYIRD